MRPDDDVEREFRTATSRLSGEPIRWERVGAPPRPRRAQRARIVATILGLTIALASAAILAKAWLDPAYKHALIGADLGFAPGSGQDVTPAPFRQYLRELNVPTSPYSREQLAQIGILVRMDFRITGLKGKRLAMRWRLYDARSGRPVPDPASDERYVILTPGAETDSGSWSMWMPRPARAGRFFVRVRLSDDRGMPLAQADSRTFALRATNH
jgi:hypothetical protein